MSLVRAKMIAQPRGTWCVVMLLCICHVSGSTYTIDPTHIPTVELGEYLHFNISTPTNHSFHEETVFRVLIDMVEWIFFGPVVNYTRIHPEAYRRIGIDASDGKTFFRVWLMATQDMHQQSLMVLHQIGLYGNRTTVFRGNISITLPLNTTYIVKPDSLPIAKVGGCIDLMVLAIQPFEPNRTFAVTVNSVEWLFFGPKKQHIEESSNQSHVLESNGETFFRFRILTTQDMSNATLKITHRLGIFGLKHALFEDTISFVPRPRVYNTTDIESSEPQTHNITDDNMRWNLRNMMDILIVGVLIVYVLVVGGLILYIVIVWLCKQSGPKFRMNV